MGDERGRDGHQGSVFVDRQVAPLEIIDGGVFHGDVIVPVLQGTRKTIVPGTALDGPDGGEGLGGDHIVSNWSCCGEKVCGDRLVEVALPALGCEAAPLQATSFSS